VLWDKASVSSVKLCVCVCERERECLCVRVCVYRVVNPGVWDLGPASVPEHAVLHALHTRVLPHPAEGGLVLLHLCNTPNRQTIGKWIAFILRFIYYTALLPKRFTVGSHSPNSYTDDGANHAW